MPIPIQGGVSELPLDVRDNDVLIHLYPYGDRRIMTDLAVSCRLFRRCSCISALKRPTPISFSMRPTCAGGTSRPTCARLSTLVVVRIARVTGPAVVHAYLFHQRSRSFTTMTNLRVYE